MTEAFHSFSLYETDNVTEFTSATKLKTKN